MALANTLNDPHLGIKSSLSLQQNELAVPITQQHIPLTAGEQNGVCWSTWDTAHIPKVGWKALQSVQECSAQPWTHRSQHKPPTSHSPGGTHWPWAAGQNKAPHQFCSPLMRKRNQAPPEETSCHQWLHEEGCTTSNYVSYVLCIH